MPDSIQSGEYSMGSGIDGASYNSDGDPNVLNANRNDDGQWLNANWDHPDNQWNDNGAFAFLVPATHSHFSPRFGGVEFFTSCPFHPPSILPTSSNISESAIYFLVSSDFVSHRIMHSNFNVSTFRVAIRTYGSFSSRERNAAADIVSMISINITSILAPSEYRCNFGSSAWYVCQSR